MWGFVVVVVAVVVDAVIIVVFNVSFSTMTL